MDKTNPPDGSSPRNVTAIGQVKVGAQPVSGAHVLVMPRGGESAPPSNPSRVRRERGTITRTDDRGYFRVEGLPPGEYGFGATAPGLLPGARLVRLDFREATVTVNLQLVSGGFAMCGRVADTRGNAVPGARFLLDIDGGLSPVDSPSANAAWVANAQGIYRMTLPVGWHRLLVEADGYVGQADWVRVNGGLIRDFHLVPASHIRGRVVERATGRPVPGAIVRIEGRPWRVDADDCVAGEDGVFESAPLEPGRYEIHASGGGLTGRASRTVVLRLSEIVSAGSISLQPGLAVVGRVIDDRGAGVSDAEVKLGADPGGRRLRGRTRSGPDGAFRLEGIEPGGASLTVRARGYIAWERDLLVRDPVALVEVVLRRSVRLVGRVCGADGRPLPDSLIVAVPNPGDSPSLATARTGPDGTFEMDDLPPSIIRPVVAHATEGVLFGESVPLAIGESRAIDLCFRGGHRVRGRIKWPDDTPVAGQAVRAEAHAWSTETFTDQGGCYSLGPFERGTTWTVAPQVTGAATGKKRVVTIERGDVDGVDFTVPWADRRISGQVTDAAGTEIPGAFVWTFPWPAGGRTLTGADGRFVIDRLTAGRYTVWVEAPGAPMVDVPQVPAGTTDLRVIVVEGGALAGTVGEVTGEPVTFALLDVLQVLDSGRRREVASLRIVDPRGAFEVGALAPGTYDLQVTSPDGLVGELAGVSLAAGQALRGVHLTVSPGVKVTGRLLAADSDTPIVGASVVAEGPVRSIPGTLDVTGTFALAGLLPGTRATLVLRADGFQSKRLTVAPGRAQIVDLGIVRLVKGTCDRHGRVGVVLDVAEDGSVLVQDVLPGLPAADAGLEAGDVITHVDGQEVHGLERVTVGDLLRGPPGTAVRLQILRDAVSHTVDVTRR